MSYPTRDVQARLNALADKQVVSVDGVFGVKTQEALRQAMAKNGVKTADELFGKDRLHRIHWHWTASTYVVHPDVLEHYNGVFDKDGKAYAGAAKPEDQAIYDYTKGIGVSHTLNANTGAIGLSVAAMAGAEGWPILKWGNYPLTWEGIDGMLKATAYYCKRFSIPVSRWSTLSHAEVQETLGIPQKQKWDFQVLPGMDKVIPAVECGDILRKRLKEKFM